MKKILAALLATAMSLSLVACGGGGAASSTKQPASSGSGSNPPAASSTPAPTGDKVAHKVIAAE